MSHGGHDWCGAAWKTILVVSLLSMSCSTPLVARVRIKDGAVRDRSAMRPTGGGPHVRSLMILPPTGSSRGDFDEYMHEFERAFLARGLKVVSSAVTGRVVQERKNESAAQLSDLERALILARETGADAVLQIGALSAKGTSTRYFCGEDGAKVTDCDESAFSVATFGRALEGVVYVFQGRVIDVRSGEILAAIDISAPSIEFLVANIDGNSSESSKPRGNCLSTCRAANNWWCQCCRNAESSALQALIDGLVQRVAAITTTEAGPVVPGSGTPTQL